MYVVNNLWENIILPCSYPTPILHNLKDNLYHAWDNSDRIKKIVFHPQPLHTFLLWNKARWETLRLPIKTPGALLVELGDCSSRPRQIYGGAWERERAEQSSVDWICSRCHAGISPCRSFVFTQVPGCSVNQTPLTCSGVAAEGRVVPVPGATPRLPKTCVSLSWNEFAHYFPQAVLPHGSPLPP